MTDTLYLHFDSLEADASLEALVVDDEGSIRTPTFRSTLAELAARHREARLIVLIPGSEALSTVTTLPKMSASQIRNALPFALEEHIAGELDRQHFAMGRPQPVSHDASTGAQIRVPLVVIEQDRIRRYCDALRAAQLEPNHLYLDESFVVGKPGDVIGWHDGQEIFLRAPTGEGLRGALDDLTDVIAMLPNDPPLSTLGLQIFGSADPDILDRVSKTLDPHRFARVQHSATSSMLEWWVGQRSIAEPIDLLQGEFATYRRRVTFDPRWRLAGVIAVMCLALHVADRWWTWQSATTELRSLEQQIAAVAPGALSVPFDNTAKAAAATELSFLRLALQELAAESLGEGVLTDVALEPTTVRVTFKDGFDPTTVARRFAAKGWSTTLGRDDTSRPTITLANRPTARVSP